MKKITVLLSALLLISTILSACNLPTSKTNKNTPSSPMDAINTAAAKTVVAMSTELARGKDTPVSLPPTFTPQAILPTTTLAPSSTVLATQASPATLTPAPVLDSPTPIPCDRAAFVTDVTIPDGTSFDPAATFTKTWRLKNNGSCTWTTSYKLVFDSGDAMSGPASANLPGNVAPGETIDLSVSLKAPDTAKTYQGFWKLQNASGAKFGLGDGNKAFWVKIAVGTPNFAVTSLNGSVDSPNFSGACGTGKTLTFSFSMTVSAPGTVKYHTQRSDSATGAQESITFDAAGTKTITETWTLSASTTGWLELYIDDPNHQALGRTSFTLTCS